MSNYYLASGFTVNLGVIKAVCMEFESDNKTDLHNQASNYLRDTFRSPPVLHNSISVYKIEGHGDYKTLVSVKARGV